MVHIGANIYYWGEAEQDRLLLEGVRPLALESRRRRLADFFWFSRFDARGPHLFVLFSTSPEKQVELCALLQAGLRRLCLVAPSHVALDETELERCHRECRGKALCASDRIAGVAANNSFVIFRHEPNGYPLWLASDMPSASEFWMRIDELTFWTLDMLNSANMRAAALGWLAAVDRALERAGFPAEAYWRHHAASLIPALKRRPETAHLEMSALLCRAIGVSNLKAFSMLWAEPPGGFDVDGLVTLIARDCRRTLQQRLQVLREVTHAVLGRLVRTVDRQIPMVLYAWQRSLSH